MFPEFLHGRVHDQQRVVRQVDRYLALEVGVAAWYVL